jgi:hypothetical protein
MKSGLGYRYILQLWNLLLRDRQLYTDRGMSAQLIFESESYCRVSFLRAVLDNPLLYRTQPFG